MTGSSQVQDGPEPGSVEEPWHEAALSAWHAWERLSFASTPLDYADAVVAMSNAMSDLGTFLPGYDYRTGTIPRYNEGVS